MTTKAEMVAILKLETPILRVGDDEQGYTDLEAADYESIISERADARLKKEAEAEQEAKDVMAKAALLKRLGITADEAALLLS